MSQQTRFDDEEVSEVYGSNFGAALFNAYTLQRDCSEHLLFSQRLRVVRAMLRAMLDEEAMISTERGEGAQ